MNTEQEGSESKCKKKREREITQTMSKRDLKDLQPYCVNKDQEEEEEGKDEGDKDTIVTLCSLHNGDVLLVEQQQ